jgi:hypothetical protein
MSDLLKHITELKEDGRITERNDKGGVNENWFDAIDSGCQGNRPRTITDNSPANRNRSQRNKKNKP